MIRRTRPSRTWPAAVATAHPNTARRFFESLSIPVDVIPISGAVEVAPSSRVGRGDRRPGFDGIDDGHERPPPDRRRPELQAVLVANPAAHRERATELTAIDTMLTAVIAARGQKYLLMNAPAAKLAELEALLPGLESPSVIPLAHEGAIAIHSVVGSDEVWGLLPRLKAAGASGILVLPIEKIVP